jgi:hypothetical protein
VEITKEIFLECTGHEPEYDDLERCNCPKAGEEGHAMCGWNSERNMPVFMVGPNSKKRLKILMFTKLRRRTEVVGEFPNSWEKQIVLKTNHRKAYVKQLMESKKRMTRIQNLATWHRDRAWMRCVKLTHIKVRSL